MTPALLYMFTGVALFVIGLHALLQHGHLLRKILAFNIMGGGVFMLLIAAANRTDSAVPDPIPHAMVLTGIVVAISATTLALGLATHLYRSTGEVRLPEQETLE